MWILSFLIALLLLLGLALLWLGRATRQQTGMPVGQVIYSDVGQWQKQEKPLLSRRFGLVGRPDYLVTVRETKRGRRRTVTIPVEVKSRPAPPTVYDSHMLQLATYCLLVEDYFKQRPPYGLVRYADATIKVPFTNGLRRQVLHAAEAIRRHRRAADVARQHNDPGRCHGCGYRHACGDKAL